MFENMNEQQARDAILKSVKEYCDLYQATEYRMRPVCMIHMRW